MKEHMENIKIAYERFELEDFCREVSAVMKQAESLQKWKLEHFCRQYLEQIERDGFDGIYRGIQEFVNLMTETINELDAKNDGENHEKKKYNKKNIFHPVSRNHIPFSLWDAQERG